MMIIVALVCAAPVLAQPVVEFGEGEVVARNLTAGSQSCWLVIAHAPEAYRNRIVTRVRIINDDDRDGVVRFSDPLLVRRESVWVVADLSNGEAVIASPDPEQVAPMPKLTPAALVSRGDGPDRFVIEGEYLTFLYVRPGTGVWMATLEDGELLEPEASVDGRIAAPLDRLKPVGDSPAPPEHFKPGDRVAVINPLRFAAGTLQIGGGKP